MEHIPSTLREIAAEVGQEIAVRLVRMTEGRHRQAYIPARPVGDSHPLVQAVGRDGASKLQQAYGGEHVNIATLKGYRRRKQARERAGRILDGLKDGKTSAELQAEHGVTQQYVSRLKAKGRSSSKWRKPRGYRQIIAMRKQEATL